MDCSICFEILNQDKNIAVTECSHKFHLKCLQLWLKTNENSTCPVCRQGIVESDTSNLAKELQEILSNEEGVIDKETAILYLDQISKGISTSPQVYNSLILYNTKLLVDVMDEPVDYIMKHKLYSLLRYHNYDDYEYDLLVLDDVTLVDYIQFERPLTVYNIANYGCTNLLNYVIENYPERITNDLYSNDRYDLVFQKTNLLGVACLYSRLELLPILVQHFDINAVNIWNCTTLYPAIASGNLQVVKWLVKNGINVNLTHVCGNSPLFYAIETKQNSIAWYLINNGAHIDYRTISICVSHSCSVAMLRYLLKHTPKPIVQTKSPHLCSNQVYTTQHIDSKGCWCIDCKDVRKDGHNCSFVMSSLLQTACYASKYEMILLLQSSSDCINDEAEFCFNFEHHVDWLKETNHKQIDYFTQIKENDLKKLLYTNCKYPDHCKPVCDYINGILERGKPVSYKHQRKIVRKLVAEATKKIYQEMWNPRPGGLGLYNSFLYR